MALAIIIALASLFFLACLTQSQTDDFIFNSGFIEANLTLSGASIITPVGALELTNSSKNIIGRAFYPFPLQVFKNSSSSVNASSFSTSFVFAVVPPNPDQGGGHGFAFTVSPSTQFPGALHSHYLGLFNPSNDGEPSNHVFAVEFDVVNRDEMFADTNGSHVGININSVNSIISKPAAYYVNSTHEEMVNLESGKPIQAWIDYDGTNEVVNVTISPLDIPKPSQPLLSHPINSSDVLKESMYVGFSAATAKLSSSHFILGWSFRINGVADSLNLSKLPSLPKEVGGSSTKFRIKIVVAVLSSVIIVIFISVILYRRVMLAENLEEWELDCPHRFHYKDLYIATKGFRESEVIGLGGFGVVYKGVLPTTGEQVAVKKISHNSVQGLREFVAEIESLGRLRHKNLVRLQGWCKRKNDLLIVYDFIPNGSLYNFLFNPKRNFVLSWEQRFRILQGIASGLLYLHEEWEQVVVHRDVKSSNVLLDAEMNARIGDFGLARLYEHGKNPRTTHVVGTVGYIAPELVCTGKSSASSDVFAYGTLLLEVACGREPIEPTSMSGHLILLDWVKECHLKGRILDAVDPKLESSYVIEEMELVLKLGLLCSQSKPEARPTMKQVTRYLNGDDLLYINGVMFHDSACVDDRNSFVVTSSKSVLHSYGSSLGSISSSSLGSGR